MPSSTFRNGNLTAYNAKEYWLLRTGKWKVRAWVCVSSDESAIFHWTSCLLWWQINSKLLLYSLSPGSGRHCADIIFAISQGGDEWFNHHHQKDEGLSLGWWPDVSTKIKTRASRPKLPERSVLNLWRCTLKASIQSLTSKCWIMWLPIPVFQ